MSDNVYEHLTFIQWEITSACVEQPSTSYDLEGIRQEEENVFSLIIESELNL
jgi:hypothetical protein